MGRRQVIVQFQGRLGNQLFQFAAGLAVALRQDAELLFYDPLGLAPAEAGGIRGILRRPFRDATRRELLAVGTYSRSSQLGWPTYFALRYIANWHATHTQHPRFVVEDDSGVSVDLLGDRFGVAVLLAGYFQSEHYFENVADRVADNLVLPQPELADLKRPVVAVTLRRGDYVTLGWTLPLSYYDNALSRLAEDESIGTLLVFSDDAEFAGFALPWLSQYGPALLGSSRGAGPGAQLGTLAACDHHVLANSSFSWWGAWLAERLAPRADRMVVAPRGWAEGNDNMVPKRWLLIPTAGDGGPAGASAGSEEGDDQDDQDHRPEDRSSAQSNA